MILVRRSGTTLSRTRIGYVHYKSTVLLLNYLIDSSESVRERNEYANIILE